MAHSFQTEFVRSLRRLPSPVLPVLFLAVLLVIVYYSVSRKEVEITPILEFEAFDNINLDLKENADKIVSLYSFPRTEVVRYNGKEFERLTEFCTWTLPFHCSLLKTPKGKIPIFHHDPAIDDAMGAVLAKNGQRDEKEIGIVLRELEKYPDAMFLDLGANIGIYTLTIAKTLQRKVLAVEPVLENAVKLCKNIQENRITNLVTLVFNPLAAMHTVVNMMKPPDHLSASEVKPLTALFEQEDPNPTCPMSLPYVTVRLDDLLPFMVTKTAVLKVDVESFEHQVIKGGLRFLREIKVPAISMEWEHVKKKRNSNEFVDLMKNLSYVGHDVDGNRLDYSLYKDWPWDIVWRKQV